MGSHLTAKPSPGLSAGLGFANLFADSTVKSLDANEYASKTFDTIQTAIKKQRNDTQAEIYQKLAASIDKYSTGALLLDISRYNDQCTLPSGITSLQDVTTTEEMSSDKQRKAAQASLTGVNLQ